MHNIHTSYEKKWGISIKLEANTLHNVWRRGGERNIVNEQAGRQEDRKMQQPAKSRGGWKELGAGELLQAVI